MNAQTKSARPWILVSLIAAFVVSLSAKASAEESVPDPAQPPGEEAESDFDAIVSQAVEAYGAQRYDEAITLFERAYSIRPQPELIYNIARVYERAVRPQEAVEQYQRFLELPNTTAELRARAITSLEALRMELEALERAQQRQQPQDPEPTPAPQPEPEGPRNILGPFGWALIGLGGAALAAGAVFGGLALSEESATEQADSLSDEQLHLDRGESFALSADLLFGIGGAVAITGIVLLIVRATRDDDTEAEDSDEDQTSWRPVLMGARGLGLTVSGRF